MKRVDSNWGRRWDPHDGHRHQRDPHDADRCWKCGKRMRPQAMRGR